MTLEDAAAVARVRALHWQTSVRCANGAVQPICSHCDTGDPYCTVANDWPCPTIAVLDGAQPEDYE